MSYLRLRQDREYFEGESETYAYESSDEAANGYLCIHDESSTPPDQDNQPHRMSVEDFYELMVSVLKTTDLDTEQVDEVAGALNRKRTHDRKQMQEFMARSDRRAGRLQRLQSEVEECLVCNGQESRCHHHEQMASAIIENRDPWADS
jgi:hypothetical protein